MLENYKLTDPRASTKREHKKYEKTYPGHIMDKFLKSCYKEKSLKQSEGGKMMYYGLTKLIKNKIQQYAAYKRRTLALRAHIGQK